MNILGKPTLSPDFIAHEVESLVWATKTIVQSHALYGREQFKKQGYYGKIASLVCQRLEADAMLGLAKQYNHHDLAREKFTIQDYHSIIVTFRETLKNMHLKASKAAMLIMY